MYLPIILYMYIIIYNITTITNRIGDAEVNNSLCGINCIKCRRILHINCFNCIGTRENIKFVFLYNLTAPLLSIIGNYIIYTYMQYASNSAPLHERVYYTEEEIIRAVEF